MKVNITNEKENPLLKRKELDIVIEHENEATPSKAALQQILSKQLGKEPEFIDIKNIFSDRGISSSKSLVFVWEEKKVEDLSKVVKEKKEKKPAETPPEKPPEGEVEPKKEEKPAEKKEEAPKEAKKEEKKEEPPKEEKKE